LRHAARQPRSWLIFDVRQKKEFVAVIAKGWSASLKFTGIPVVKDFECDGIEPECERQFTVKKELRPVSESRVRVMAAACLERKSEGFGRFSPASSSARFNPRQKPNKAPEPTPGLVTSRAEMVLEMISSRKARLAPSPVVAHL